jgi:membrane associated rhomboid family serine protease
MSDSAASQPPASAPPEPASSPDAPKAAAAEFTARLQTVTPRAWVVPALVAANAVAFAVMVARGASPISPSAGDLIGWGANFGPATLGGQPWRLLASTFLHFGALHLAMNMLALWNVGRLVERLFGNARFAALYLAAGIFGSTASVLQHPDVVSAGASGAVFGVYAALGGFLLQQRRSIPGPVLAGLRNVAVSFVGYNLVFGLTNRNIDMAAHVGGLVGGFAAGALLARPLAPGRSQGVRGAGLIAAASLALIGIVGWLPSPAERVPLAPRELPGFTLDLPAGETMEQGTAYDTGRLMLKGPSGGAGLMVVWQGGATPREELKDFALAIASALKIQGLPRLVTTPGPDGVPVDTAVVGESGSTARVAAIQCGKRSVVVFALGGFGAEALHRRVLASFRCRPDPQQESADPGLPVVLELPGWYAIDRSGGGGTVVLSDGRSTLLLRRTVVGTTPIEQVLEASFAGKGGRVIAAPAGPDAAVYSGTLSGAAVEGWGRYLRCPSTGVLLLFSAPDRASSEQARALAEPARCTAAGEAPTRWPDKNAQPR